MKAKRQNVRILAASFVVLLVGSVLYAQNVRAAELASASASTPHSTAPAR